MPFISFAQNLEDVVLHRALRGITHGFYVDVGANSPDEQSVTKAFYERGWHGINIEPALGFHEELIAARPHDINLAVAAGDSTGTVTFYDIPGSELSTGDSELARQHQLSGLSSVERQVPLDTLDNIFETHGVSLVHFLKIDVEGMEAAVLRGLSLKTVRPWIILVEATVARTEIPNYHEWDPLLTSQCYRFVHFDGLNRFYVAEEKAELIPHLEIQPNIFDDWIRAHDSSAHQQVAILNNQINADRAALDAEREVRRAEAQARIAELDARKSEQAAWQADVETRLTEWQRVGNENVALRQRIAELDAIAANLNRYIGDVQVSMSWRLTAPIRGAKRALEAAWANLTLAPASRTRSCVAQAARIAMPWAAGHPLVRRTLLPILMRYPALERTARALLSRWAVVHATPSEPAITGFTPLAGLLVARPLSATERNLEAMLRRALARTH